MTKNEAASVAQMTDEKIDALYFQCVSDSCVGKSFRHAFARAILAQAAPPSAPVQGVTLKDYEEAFADHQRMVRALDVLLNGDAAAKQASLCDIVAQVRNEGIRSEGVSLTEKQQKDLHSHMMAVACRTWDETPSTSIKAHLRAVVKAIAAEPKIRAALLAAPAAPASGGTPDSFPARLLNESDASLAERVDSWHKRNAAPATGESGAEKLDRLERVLAGYEDMPATPPAAEAAAAQQDEREAFEAWWARMQNVFSLPNSNEAVSIAAKLLAKNAAAAAWRECTGSEQ